MAATVETLKGTAAPATFQVHAVKTPSIVKAAAVGQPVVVFEGLNQSVVHVADQWATAIVVPKIEPRRWRTVQLDATGHRDFPGSTAALANIVRELKAGTYSLLDVYDGKPFTGGAKQVAILRVTKPTFMIAADINGDGKPDLIVGAADGIRLFLAVNDGYSDATEKWGLAGVSGAHAAGDLNGDGKVGLLIGKTLFRNDGQKLIADTKAIDIGPANVLSAGFVASTGKLPDAAFLLDDGRLLLLKNPGRANEPWPKLIERKIADAGSAPQAAAFGDFSSDGAPGAVVLTSNAILRFPLTADGAPSDFAHLTGNPLDEVVKPFVARMKNPVITTIDINGDKRTDLVISTDEATLLLINRGFGALLADKEAGAALAASGGSVPLAAVKTRCAMHGASGDDLLILTDDGKLFSVTTPPVKPK